VFTFLIPVLVVVNVPARILVRPLSPNRRRLAAAGFRASGHAGQPSRIALVFSAGAEELSKREQLKGKNYGLRVRLSFCKLSNDVGR